MRKKFITLLTLAAIGGAVYGGITLKALFEGDPPQIEFIDAPAVAGRKGMVKLRVTDSGAGLTGVKVTLIQEGTEHQLGSERFELPEASYEADAGFDPRQFGLRDGPATVEVTARDASRRNGGQGNEARVIHELEIRTKPPQVQVLSKHHNATRGGSQMVTFRVRGDVRFAGVTVDDRTFQAFPSAADPTVYATLFALPHDAKSLEPKVFAEDSIGNRAERRFYHQIRDRSFPTDTVRIPPALIDKCRDDFPIPTNLDDVATFKAVNNDLRIRNHVQLERILKTAKVPEALFSETFLRLPNSARKSNFAERRTYLFDGEEIDKQFHLGIDLASFRNADIPASADGVVLFADELGIYGQTVILDHGFGLTTLYSHMSTMAVNAGDSVQRGQSLGNTGLTGLALGDHLHYGIYVNGIAVDPVEWWDGSWITKRIAPKLELWRAGGVIAEEATG